MDRKTVTRQVEEILEFEDRARNSDEYLYAMYLSYYGKGLLDWTVADFLKKRRALGVPSIETVGRCRRKIQEKYPYLRASQEVEEARAEKEMEWREYARK